MSFIPVDEFKRRIKNCREAMSKEGVDALFVFSDYLRQHNIRYLAGYIYQPSWLAMSTLILPLDGEPVLIIDIASSWNLDKVRRESWIKDVRCPSAWMRVPGPSGAIENLAESTIEAFKEKNLAESEIGVVGLDCMPALYFEKIKRQLPRVKFRDITESIERLRMIKSDFEIQMIRKTVGIVDAGLRVWLENLAVGKKEYEVGVEVLKEVIRRGMEDKVGVWVRSGPENTRSPGVPHLTDRTIENGDLVWCDMGICSNGYFGDAARSTIAGKAAEKKKELCNACLVALESAINAVKPGVTIAEVFEEARRRGFETGYGEYFVIGYWGHGLGVQLDEFPVFAPDESTVLRPNMVMAISPKFYVPGFGGVVIEDDILVTEDGAEILNKFDRELW